ncbi:MAG: succinate dehydrogenase, hydrophobic membrane anchor protein [Alphaproteobacteria bacterium]|nr:succinate dehydrogenase, hydrophobic membrane anchor protein [Alphaproteobacteria bacterium]
MSLRTPLSKARGLGSAKDGVGHFIGQRATAIANIPLVTCFLVSVVLYGAADYETARAYLAHPVVTILMGLFFVSIFNHMRLGLQVIIEDYVANDGSRLALVLLVNFAAFAAVFSSLFCLARISFAG